jgi:positive regulator of sigma E activity
MIRERGTVTSVESHFARISIGRAKKCIGCKHCITAKDGTSMIATAVNNMKANIGDSVIIESGEINQIADGFLLFILPLIIIIFAIIIGIATNSVFWGLLIAITLLSLLFLYFKINKDKYQFKIVEIISDDRSSELHKDNNLTGGVI